MKLLIVSDSHSNSYALRKVLMSAPSDIVFHLGDGESELSALKPDFPGRMFLQARGNCDWCSSAPAEGIFETEGVKIFYCHGHTLGVKRDLLALRLKAEELGCKIALFGHTHEALNIYENGIYLLNPGSLSGYAPSFGTIEIRRSGILTNITSLK